MLLKYSLKCAAAVQADAYFIAYFNMQQASGEAMCHMGLPRDIVSKKWYT